MTVNDLLNNTTASWIKNEYGKDPVIHVKLFLSRNLQGFPFPGEAGLENENKIADMIRQAVSYWNSREEDQLIEYPLTDLNKNEQGILQQKSYIPLMHSPLGAHSSLYLNEPGDVSLATNMVDDLRIQLFAPYDNAKDLWYRTSYMDDVLSQKLLYAFDKEFGYLTAYPENAGTGLTMSALLFIPGLSYENRVDLLKDKAARFGFTVRPLIPNEFMKVPLYEAFSNTSMGVEEFGYYKSFMNLLDQITESEEEAWNEVFHENEMELRDKVWRAIGTLKYARMINSDELAELASSLAIGIREKMIPAGDVSTFQKIFDLTSPELVNEITVQENKGSSNVNAWRALLVHEAMDQLGL